jgi:hypothetical protein
MPWRRWGIWGIPSGPSPLTTALSRLPRLLALHAVGSGSCWERLSLYVRWLEAAYRVLCVAHGSGCCVDSGLQNLLACHRAYATAIATALGGGGGMALVDQQVKLQTAGGGAGSSAGGVGAAGAGAGERTIVESLLELQPPGGLWWACRDPNSRARALDV